MSVSIWIDLGTIVVQPHGVGPFDFAWSNTNDTDSLATHLEDGLYAVTVTDVNGCTVNTAIDITSLPPLNFSIDPYYEITFGDTLSLHIEGDTLTTNIYQWQPAGELSCSNCASLFAFPEENVTLTIEITDSLQCHYFLQTNIVVNPVEPLDTIIADAVYIPNVFSPNGDNSNDIFSIYSRLPDVHLQELTIMDRWGELVFYTDNIPLESFKGWDGNFNDKPMNPQVFVYIAKLKLSDGKDVKLVGDVTLIR